MKKTLLFIFAVIFTGIISGQTVLGIDVSHHQGDIDWTQVYADGKVFAFVKASEGMTYEDPKFTTNMINGIDAGVVMGTYHFARPDNNTAIQDAGNFVSVAEDYIGTGFLQPVLDLEDPGDGTHLTDLYTSSELTTWVQDWIDYVVTETGIDPIIYTTATFANYLNSSLNSYPLWIAEPDGNVNPPDDIGNWDSWLFKQYSWTGSVPGIVGDVDMNVFNGSIDDFNNLVSAGPVNDNCFNATNLLSYVSCNNIAGTVNGAVNEGVMSVVSCDDFSGTSAAHDVFYEFTAFQETHTIIVEPTGDLDAVVALYEGSDCSNLSEIYCIDEVGVGVVTTIVTTDLTIGNTYWIRIYDYGEQVPTDGDFNICITHPNTDDVFISNFEVTPLTVNSGNTVSVQCDYEYSGSTPDNYLPIVNIAYILSEDCIFDGSDILLGGDAAVLGSNNPVSPESATLTIPSNTNTGTYYILFVSDSDNEMEEINEDNNVECVQIMVNNTVSISEISFKNSVKLFPNPTSGIVNIETDRIIKFIEVFDITGKMLLFDNSNENQIDLSDLLNGLYFIRVIDENNNLAIFKILKQ